MPYKLTSSAWELHAASRVRGVLLLHMNPGQEYTVSELLSMLSEYGPHYSTAQYVEIGRQLIAQAVIELVD